VEINALLGWYARGAATWFNLGAFAAPSAYTFGDVGRNTVFGPGLQPLDLALDRVFNMTEKSSFEAHAVLAASQKLPHRDGRSS
jgi:hypothetical protein